MKPKAYDPQDGYKYQIFCRNQRYDRSWEHCDYAKDRQERFYLIGEYRLAYGPGWEFKYILLPRKYWPKDAEPVPVVPVVVHEETDAEYHARMDDIIAREKAKESRSLCVGTKDEIQALIARHPDLPWRDALRKEGIPL